MLPEHIRTQRGALTIRILGILLVSGGLVLSGLFSFFSYNDLFRLLSESFPIDTVRRHFSQDLFKSLTIQSRLGGFALAAAGVWLIVHAASYGTILDRHAVLFLKDAHKTIRDWRFSISWQEGMFLLAITAAGAALRWHFIDRVMRYDESVTFLRFASKPLYIALAAYTEPNNHIFHTLLVKISALLFGNSEWAIRLPALVAGVLLIPASYLIGRTSGLLGAGIWAAAGTAASPALIEYSVNARGYTIQALLCVLSAWFLYQALAQGRITYFLIYSICLTLGLWTIPTMLFAVAGMAIYFLWWMKSTSAFSYKVLQKRFWAFTALALLLAGVLYLPVLISHGPRAIFANPYVRPKAASTFIASNARQISELLSGLHSDWPYRLELLILGSMAVCLMFGLSQRLQPLGVFLSLFASTTVIVAACRMIPPARAYLFLVPFYFCCAASGLGLILRHVTRHPVGILSVQAAALAFTVAAGWGIWKSDRITNSTDTGVLLSAREITAALKSRGVCWNAIEGHYVSKLVLEYYWRESPDGPVDQCPDGQGAGKALIVNSVLKQDIKELRPGGLAESQTTEVLQFPKGDLLFLMR